MKQIHINNLNDADYNTLRQLAEKIGLKPSPLARMWILERLRKET